MSGITKVDQQSVYEVEFTTEHYRKVTIVVPVLGKSFVTTYPDYRRMRCSECSGLFKETDTQAHARKHVDEMVRSQ